MFTIITVQNGFTIAQRLFGSFEILFLRFLGCLKTGLLRRFFWGTPFLQLFLSLRCSRLLKISSNEIFTSSIPRIFFIGSNVSWMGTSSFAFSRRISEKWKIKIVKNQFLAQKWLQKLIFGSKTSPKSTFGSFFSIFDPKIDFFYSLLRTSHNRLNKFRLSINRPRSRRCFFISSKYCNFFTADSSSCKLSVWQY